MPWRRVTGPPSPFDYRGRLERAREMMRELGLDALLLSLGADLPYLTGYEAMPLERLTMLVLPAGEPATLVVPRLEEPRVEPRPEVFAVRAWEETEDPLDVVAGLVGRAEGVALGDQTWAVFLLGLQERLPGTRFLPASTLTRELRMRKDPGEVDRLRRAAAAADRVMDRLRRERFSGRTERELARWIAAALLEEGHQTSAFTIVASGPNAASPHHEPGDRAIEEGDWVVVDFGGRLDGYHSDTTRTFVVGEPSGEPLQAYQVLLSAQERAVAAVAPGRSAEEIDRVARRAIEEAGYGDRFIHRTGHGIGLEGHEHPYLVEGNRLPLEPGMAFSVEPGIYLSDRWGMRIEDIVVVTEGGAERLNRSDRSPLVVG